MQAKNAKRVIADGSRIDVEINHPVYGWIPFTASVDDVEPLGRAIHARALAGEFGAVVAYDGPDAATQSKFTRKGEIIARLSAIDTDSIRALRAKAAGKGKAADDTKLQTLDAEADALRLELAGLGV